MNRNQDRKTRQHRESGTQLQQVVKPCMSGQRSRARLAAAAVMTATFCGAVAALAGGGRTVVVTPHPAGAEVPVAPNERVGAVHVVKLPGGEQAAVVRIDAMPAKPDFNIITPNGVSHPFKNGEYIPGINVTWSSVYVHSPTGDYWCVMGTFSKPGVGTIGRCEQNFPPGSQRVPDPPQPPGLVFWSPGAYAVDPATEALVLNELGMPDNPWVEVWEAPAGQLLFWHYGSSAPEAVMINSLPALQPNLARRQAGAAIPEWGLVALWDDDFDDYELGSGLHGQGGWKGWGNDPTVDAYVTDAQARSAPHAADVAGATDIVHEYEGFDRGRWALTTWQYIPSDFVGGSGGLDGSFFVIMNAYSDAGPYEAEDWSVQLQFDSNDGMLKIFHGDGMNTIDTPYVTDRWVCIQAVVDLDSDLVTIRYDDVALAQYSWTGGVLGGGHGARNIAAVDLYANGSTSMYYDDLSLKPARP